MGTCSTKFLVQLLGRWVLWKCGSFGIVRGLLPWDNILEGVKALALELLADASCIAVSCWPCLKHGDLAFLKLAVFNCVALDLSGVILDFLNLTFPSEVLLILIPLSVCKLSDMTCPNQVILVKKWNILTNYRKYQDTWHLRINHFASPLNLSHCLQDCLWCICFRCQDLLHYPKYHKQHIKEKI